ncbi:MAG: hypothetical protein AABY18_00030 [Candidatus Thermoplasmatota archaeon]
MRPVAWGALGIVALLAAAALLVGAFTRFDDGPPPRQGQPGFADYEQERYDQARASTFLGVAAAFALLGAAACLQKAWRGRTRP